MDDRFGHHADPLGLGSVRCLFLGHGLCLGVAKLEDEVVDLHAPGFGGGPPANLAGDLREVRVGSVGEVPLFPEPCVPDQELSMGRLTEALS